MNDALVIEFLDRPSLAGLVGGEIVRMEAAIRQVILLGSDPFPVIDVVLVGVQAGSVRSVWKAIKKETQKAPLATMIAAYEVWPHLASNAKWLFDCLCALQLAVVTGSSNPPPVSLQGFSQEQIAASQAFHTALQSVERGTILLYAPDSPSIMIVSDIPETEGLIPVEGIPRSMFNRAAFSRSVRGLTERKLEELRAIHGVLEVHYINGMLLIFDDKRIVGDLDKERFRTLQRDIHETLERR